MALSISADEFQQLREYIETICGIAVGADKSYLIESRLSSLVEESGCDSFGSFYQKVRLGNDAALRDRIVDLMTTNETLWFRDTHPFTIFKEVLLPQFSQEIKEGKRFKVRIWSAASSTGQEPYSLAMIILEAMAAQPHLQKHHFEILATDISSTALRMASLARYDRIAISRGLPETYRARFFKDEGRVWSLTDDVKNMVRLKRFNLQDSPAAFGRFDIILCRNVAIYFSDDFKRALFGRLARALNPGGCLFLGAAESLSAYSSAFEMQEHNRGIYYRLRS